jgi:hypothetical protein
LIASSLVDLISDSTGLIGSVSLVQPAIRVNGLSRLRSKVANMRLSPRDDPAFAEMKSETESDLENAEKSWSYIDQACLFGGLGLVIFSFAVKIVWNLVFAP